MCLGTKGICCNQFYIAQNEMKGHSTSKKEEMESIDFTRNLEKKPGIITNEWWRELSNIYISHGFLHFM